MTVDGALGELLLRQVPEHLRPGVSAGELKVFGSVVRAVATGQIKCHLQETSGLARLVENALSGSAHVPLPGAAVGLLGRAANIAQHEPIKAVVGIVQRVPVPGAGTAASFLGGAVNIAQNEQIKAAVSIVQQLQVANLALGAIGIGVSVAGLAVLSAKISRIESRMDDISIDLDRLAKGVESLRQDRIAEDFTRLRTTGEMMDEAWLLSDPGPQWRLVATEAHAIANTFERRACELLDQGQELATVDPFLEGLALAASTRVAARLAAGDDVVGSRAAEEGARALIRLGQRLQLSGATLREMRDGSVQPASPEWGRALDGTADRLKPAFAALRDREAAAASTVLTVRELGRQGIRGRAWLAAAREEEESPLLCLVPAET